VGAKTRRARDLSSVPLLKRHEIAVGAFWPAGGHAAKRGTILVPGVIAEMSTADRELVLSYVVWPEGPPSMELLSSVERFVI